MSADVVIYDIKLKNIKDWKKPRLIADLNFFVENVKFEILNELEKIKNNKTLLAKYLNLFEKFDKLLIKENIEVIFSMLSTKLNFSYKIIEDRKNYIHFQIYIDKSYFDFQKQHKFIKTLIKTKDKEGIKKEFEKACKEYTNDYKIEYV